MSTAPSTNPALESLESESLSPESLGPSTSDGLSHPSASRQVSSPPASSARVVAASAFVAKAIAARAFAARALAARSLASRSTTSRSTASSSSVASQSLAATPAEPGCKTAGEAAAKLTETGNSAAGSGTIEHTANGNSIIGSDYIIGSDNGSDYLDRQLAELKHDYVAAQNTTDPGAAHFDKAAQDFPSGHHFAAAEQQVPNGRLSPAPKVGVAAADFTAAEFAAVGFASASLTSSASLANANSPTNALGADGAALALEPPVVSGPLDGLIYATVKRLLDLVISLAMLVLLSPLLLLTAILVKLTDGGPVFYPHVRIGEGGNEFTCYKFRSMVVNAEKMKANLAFYNSHDDHKTFKIPNDPRVTWIGRWMRRASIDELPQLLNVLRGEMSVVGPRPPVVSEVEKYTWDDMQRLTVKPGLTCIWQVSGRSRLPFPEQLKMDLQYIENRSLALDLKLILLTVPAVLSADGAY